MVFADRNPEALQSIREALAQAEYRDKANKAEFWQVDFEQAEEEPLGRKQFGAILVFRYLHRPLFPAIRQAVSPGGVLVYETFTREQAQLGRPKNPDFLLEAGELARYFADWQILHRFEGLSEPVDGGSPSAIAQVVARKPPIAD